MSNFKREDLTGQTYMGCPTPDVPGYGSEHFHIAKPYRKGLYWTVTHKPTDTSVPQLGRATMAATKAAVTEAERLFIWGASTVEGIARDNGFEKRAWADVIRGLEKL